MQGLRREWCNIHRSGLQCPKLAQREGTPTSRVRCAFTGIAAVLFLGALLLPRLEAVVDGAHCATDVEHPTPVLIELFTSEGCFTLSSRRCALRTFGSIPADKRHRPDRA